MQTLHRDVSVDASGSCPGFSGVITTTLLSPCGIGVCLGGMGAGDDTTSRPSPSRGTACGFPGFSYRILSHLSPFQPLSKRLLNLCRVTVLDFEGTVRASNKGLGPCLLALLHGRLGELEGRVPSPSPPLPTKLEPVSKGRTPSHGRGHEQGSLTFVQALQL